MSKDQLVQDIKTHIAKCGGRYSDWYVGIASDPKERLFEDHNVQKDSDDWIYKDAENQATARAIEGYFVDELGTDGGEGGGDASTKWVYAYRKNAHTKE